jgi:hypothetical protein
MACDPHGDDVVFPLIGDEDLIAARLSSEHDDNSCDPYSLFDDEVARGTAADRARCR